MKKIIILAALALSGFNAAAQAKIGNNPSTVHPDAVLDLESSDKGLLHTRVALTGTANAAPLSAHVAGMVVYNTANTADVSPGLYSNDGTKWVRVTAGQGNAPASTVTANCTGFTGTNYTAGTGTRTYVVRLTNQSYSQAVVPIAVGNLVLSPGSGLTVSSVSSASVTISAGGSADVTFNLTGNLSAAPGSTITGTFTNNGLSCSNSVTVGNNAPVVSAGSNQTIYYPVAATVTNLSGSATDADGTVASYLWTRTGGTGASTPVFTSPTTASTSVSGIDAAGTYIFTLAATDNLGAVSNASATVTVANPTGVVNGPNGTTLTFMAHNLGSTYSANPHTANASTNGNYYQWGRATAVATATTGAGGLSGWDTSYAPENSWNSGTEAAPVKTSNDPCPQGFRVPTSAELSAAVNTANGNTLSSIGTWESSSNVSTNYSAAVRISTGGTVRLQLPAAGRRTNGNGFTTQPGSLDNRGRVAYYWTSASSGASSARILSLSVIDGFDNESANGILVRNNATPLRCIKE